MKKVPAKSKLNCFRMNMSMRLNNLIVYCAALLFFTGLRARVRTLFNRFIQKSGAKVHKNDER